LSEQDRKALLEWSRAKRLQTPDAASLSLSDASRRGRSLSASSMSLSSDLPIIVRSSWLRDCWNAKQKLDEQDYRLPWPTTASNALSRTASANSVADDTSLRPGESIDMSSDGRSVVGLRSEQGDETGSMLPPHPQHLMTGSRTPSAARPLAAQGVKRQHFAGPLVAGKSSGIIGQSKAIDVDNDTDDEDEFPHKRSAVSIRGGYNASTALPIDISSSSSCSPESRAPLRHRDGGNDKNSGSELGLALPAVSEPIINDNGSEQANSQPSTGQIFRGCVFASIGLTDNADQTLKSVVVGSGGEFIDLFAHLLLGGDYEQLKRRSDSELATALYQALTFVANTTSSRPDTAVYIVIQLSGIEEVPLCEAIAAAYPHMHIVTECWVESCLYYSNLYPSFNEIVSNPNIAPVPGLNKGQHALFRPLWRNQVADAEKMALSISGYEGIERDHIGKLALALKIPFSERFSRKTTHLICNRPFKGPKYERAVKWHTPVVDSSWLYEIALSSRAEPDADSVDVFCRNLQVELQSTTPASAKVDRERSANYSASIRNTAHDTPLNRLARSLDKNTPGRTPIDVSLDKNMQQALGNNNKNSNLLRHPQLGSGHHGYEDDSTQMSPTRGAYPANHGSGDLISRMAGSENCNPTNADTAADTNRKILNGVVVALTTRLYHMRHDFAKLALELGCRFLPRFDASQVTHLVHQSHRKKETAKDYRIAIENDIEVVSPWWLFACRDALRRVPESDFPYTFHPERRLKLVPASPAKPLQMQNASSSMASVSPGAKKSPVVTAASPMQARGFVVQTLDTTGDLPLLASSSLTGSADKQHSLKRAADTDTRESIAAANAELNIDTSGAINSLFAERASRTRRKYRMANDGGDNQMPDQGQSVNINIGSATRPITSSSSQRSHSARSSSTTSSSVPSAGVAGVANSTETNAQISGKWWLSAEHPSSAGYNSANNMRLYSQEFQLSGNKSVESMPNTGFFGETQQNIVGQWGNNAGSAAAAAVPSVGSGARPGPNSSADVGGRARKRAAGTVTFEQNAAGNEAAEPRSSSSPLAAQKTMIVYEEDARALSEKERLLAKLGGN
ncbi:protein kinase activating protein dpb11, partial [Coemansia erecta]